MKWLVMSIQIMKGTQRRDVLVYEPVLDVNSEAISAFRLLAAVEEMRTAHWSETTYCTQGWAEFRTNRFGNQYQAEAWISAIEKAHDEDGEQYVCGRIDLLVDELISDARKICRRT